jgi:hypothetical protein
VILSIIEILYNDNKREYELDLLINPDFALKTLKSTNSFVINANADVLTNLYNIIINKYEKDSKGRGYYGFYPKFNYSKEVVDSFFIRIMDQLNYHDEFLQITENNIKLNDKVFEIIDTFYSFEGNSNN